MLRNEPEFTLTTPYPVVIEALHQHRPATPAEILKDQRDREETQDAIWQDSVRNAATFGGILVAAPLLAVLLLTYGFGMPAELFTVSTWLPVAMLLLIGLGIALYLRDVRDRGREWINGATRDNQVLSQGDKEHLARMLEQRPELKAVVAAWVEHAPMRKRDVGIIQRAVNVHAHQSGDRAIHAALGRAM